MNVMVQSRLARTSPLLTWAASRLAFYGKAMLQNLHVRYKLANLVAGSLPEFASGTIRAQAYRWAGFDLARGCSVAGNMRLTSGMPGFYDKLHVGRDTVIAPDVTINLDESVHMGTRVSISPYVRIYTGTHQLGPGSKRMSPAVNPKPVVIEDGCWIGVGALILPGTTIGQGAVVGAGAVVTRDVPANTYVEGNPAQVVRNLPWGNR